MTFPLLLSSLTPAKLIKRNASFSKVIEMVKIVECVPNFSEGQCKKIIDAISQAISSTTGVSLLDVDPGSSTNRTVYTFVGSPENVVEGALNAAKAAYKLIDMRKHKGEHPRMGALDVCPFIPVQGVSMEDCVECSKRFGLKLAEELKVPVYLYGYAAKEDYRRTMPQIRAGEYENLPQKLEKTEWKPDYGPAEFVPQWGATVTGARKFLIAYNINVLSTKEHCHRIALNIREQGRGKDQPGRLKNVQAIGWYLEESNLAQISVNITDFEVTPIHVVFEEACKDAKELSIPVVGSQIVGLVPLKSILDAAEFYIKKENLFILEEEQKVRLAINRLGLGTLTPFEPNKRIIEYMLPEDTPGLLISLTLKNFILSVGARTSAPGGGSVAAVIACLGAALGSMVSLLTYGNRKYENLDSKMRYLIPKFHQVMNELLPMIDEDTNAFNDYMLACKMSKNTKDEQALRDAAQENGLKKAIEVPLRLAQITNTLWEPMKELAEIGNETAISDLQVAARSLETGVWGAYYNVIINIKNIKNIDYKTKIEDDINAEVKKAESCRSDILSILSQRYI